MKWFRFYAEARRDPKIRRLSDRQYRIWTDVLCLALEYDGEIPVASLLQSLTYKTDHTIRVLGDLVDYGLLASGGGLIIPHNWYVRQYKSDSSVIRSRRYRARKRASRSDGLKRHAVTAPEKKESKKERELAKKWAAELERRLRLAAESNVTDITSLKRLKPLGEWKD